VFEVSSGTKKALPRDPDRHGASHQERTMGPSASVTHEKPSKTPEGRAPSLTKESIAQIMDAGKRLAVFAGLDALYAKIAAEAMSILDADAAHIFTKEKDHVKVSGSAGFSLLNGRRFPADPSLVGWVAKMGESIVVPDIAKAPASWEKDLFAAAGFQAHLFVPVEWAGQRLAVLCLHSRPPHPWSTQEISLLDMFVGFVAVALENARLYRESEDKASALTALNQKLAEALQVKTRFLATVSHELRSPLFVINGYANLIADQMFGPVPTSIQGAIGKILKQGSVLMSLISNLLEISQMETGSLTVQLAPMDLTEVLDEVAASMRQLIGERPVTFAIDYDRGCQLIVSDRIRLKQILAHLLDNAAKFTHEGKIVLHARVDQNGAEIVVEDTGIGIDPGNQNLIFDGFRQVDEEDTRRYEGMGMGLYLSRKFVELLGGEITVKSEAGSGARFRIWLPRAEGTPTGDRRSEDIAS
jgi:signal transduction histidine kinase